MPVRERVLEKQLHGECDDGSGEDGEQVPHGSLLHVLLGEECARTLAPVMVPETFAEINGSPSSPAFRTADFSPSLREIPHPPPEEILRRIDEDPKIDLVVMATHGRHGVAWCSGVSRSEWSAVPGAR